MASIIDNWITLKVKLSSLIFTTIKILVDNKREKPKLSNEMTISRIYNENLTNSHKSGSKQMPNRKVTCDKI